MDKALAAVRDALDLIERRIQQVSDIAAPKAVAEVVPYSQSGQRNARKRTPINGKNTFEVCGPEGSEQVILQLQRWRLLDQA
ncbi:MAG: hypothetical protein WA783_23180 [Phormidesmis sp.]